MYFHFHLDDQGFSPLSMLFKRIAIEEMGHVERLAERILFLKGDVAMKLAGAVEQITDPEHMVTKAAQMEEALRRLAEERGLSSGKVFQPLRVALVGQLASPGIFDVLVALGRDKSLTRLDRAVSFLENAKV